MDLKQELDRLENLILDSARVPITGKVLVSEDQVLDLLDRVRVSLPDVVTEAASLVARKQTYMAQAQAQSIREQADQELDHLRQEAARLEQQTRQQVEQLRQDVFAEIQTIRETSISEAQSVQQKAIAEAQSIQAEADRYVGEILGNLENNLVNMLQIVRNGKQNIQ